MQLRFTAKVKAYSKTVRGTEEIGGSAAGSILSDLG